MTKNVLVMEKFHFYDQNDQLIMVDQNVTELLWPIQFGHKLVIKSVLWPNLHVPWPNRLVIDVEYCTSEVSQGDEGHLDC
jgi:hypothetical protein